VQEASPEGWQEISPGWSASDTRGCLFNANRTPEGCEDNLDSSAAEEGSSYVDQLVYQSVQQVQQSTQNTQQSMVNGRRANRLVGASSRLTIDC